VSVDSDPNTLCGKLAASCPDEWKAYVDHEFVRGLADGTLPEPCFRHYLQQDYLFLIQFARAWALAVYKADNLAEMRAAAAGLDAILNQEIRLHVQYCEGWGISERELESLQEEGANIAYTRYVLERGIAGDLLDLYVALAPCIIGYAVIGAGLVNGPATVLEGNPYKDWIEMYSGDEYQEVAASMVRTLDDLAAVRMGPGRFDSLAATFRQATLLEIDFWEMGLSASS
jgi:thiaminase/transcriptional activator TenA